MLLCNYCNSKIDKQWNFCPKCGNKLRGALNLNEIINRQMDYFKKMLDITGYDISIVPDSDNSFVINITHGFEDRDQPITSDEPTFYKADKTQIKLPKNISEPEMVVKRKKDNILFEVKLPGIKKEEDIELIRMQNSIEVRARRGNLGYFKILKTPSNYKLVRKEFDNENLLLEFVI
ncbi:hypothetical protein A3K63_00495 [Candidatus Micrarchaeota archaeon RBG_16_49_10]|nr:MAG: hypothetical protein A3K63_00495 [Candidatus Micrarchaeota archaeon RBG_16_49_10]